MNRRIWIVVAAAGAVAQAARAGVVQSLPTGRAGASFIPVVSGAGLLAAPSAVSLGDGLVSAIPSAALPGLTAAPAASVIPEIGAPAAGMTERAAVPGATADLLKKAVADIEAAAKRPGAAQSLEALGKRFFDFAGPGFSGFGGGRADFRPPTGGEDHRINRALQAVGYSQIGTQVYQEVYKRYGANLTFHVDDDRSASYDARLSWVDGKPRITLTEGLLNRWSPEATASYIVREMSDLYYEGFPVSAERGYLSYSNMVRAFAEMTNSDLNAYGKAWATDKDQYLQGQYAIQNYYGNWRAATEDAARGYSIQNTQFMRFLRGSDDSNTERASKLTLEEQYYRGMINYSQYREMLEYFNGIVASEWQWINDSGRR